MSRACSFICAVVSICLLSPPLSPDWCLKGQLEGQSPTVCPCQSRKVATGQMIRKANGDWFLRDERLALIDDRPSGCA